MSQVSLLDVNVLVALAWPVHLHHASAHAWFARHRSRGWATCPSTQAAFVRLSANPSLFQNALSPVAACALLEKIVAVPGHRFMTDDISFADSKLVFRARLIGYRQVTDAHLLAVALRHRARLATFDRGVLGLVPPGIDPESTVALLPPLS